MSKKAPFIYILCTLVLVIVLIFAIIALLILLKDDDVTPTTPTTFPTASIPLPTNGNMDSLNSDDYAFGSQDGAGEPDLDQVLYSIYSDTTGNLYLRSQSFGDYVGQGWKKATAYPELIDGTYAASYLTAQALAQENAALTHVIIQSYGASYVLPYYAATAENTDNIQTNDTVNTGSISTPYSTFFYNCDASTFPFGEYSGDFEPAYRDFVYTIYLDIDQETRDYMETIIRQEQFSKDNDNIIADVAHYIQNAATYNLEFDPSLEQSSNVAIAFLETYKEGVCRHYATAATLLYRALGIPARFTVGAFAKAQAEQWVDIPAGQSHAWVEVYLDGVGWIQVEVTGSTANGDIPDTPDYAGSTLQLKPNPVAKIYDGTPLYPDGTVDGFSDWRSRGFYYDVDISGEGLEPGVTQSYIEDITIYDPDGNDVTQYFNIETTPGVIQVFYDRICLHSKNAAKEYDGQPASVELILNEGTLREGDHWIAESTASVEIGQRSNLFNVSIVDAQGNDVTELYQIQKSYGTLRICYDTLLLVSNSITTEYTGKPVDLNVTILDGTLEYDHHLTASSNVGTAIGQYNHAFDPHIIDGNGQDVTGLYILKKIYGDVTITHRHISLKADDATKVYDGQALYCDSFIITAGMLLEGHRIVDVQYEGSQTNIGRSECSIRYFRIVDDYGNDVTANYSVDLEPGKLRVTRN